MSKIEDLIKQYCPNGCEWKTVGECVRILDGQRKPITKAARIAGKYPYYGANGVQDYVADYILDGTYVLIGEDGSVVTPEGCPIVHWVEGKIWVNNHAHVVGEMPGVSLRYFFYAISNCNVSNLIHGNIPKLNQSDFKAIMIPVPHIAVQDEIVRILDKFTELEKELEKELELRRKQYEFYRDELLTFGDDVERIATKDLVESKFWLMPATPSYVDFGVRYITSKNIKNGKIDFSTASFISKEDYEELSKNRYVKTGDLLITMIGTIGECAFVEDETEFYGQNLYLVRLDDSKINRRYYKYYFEKSKSSLIAKKNDSSQGYLKAGSIDGLIIPVPSPTEQERIVKILDKFDTLTTSLTSGLPAEIKLRKQQYEYYRDYLFGLLN